MSTSTDYEARITAGIFHALAAASTVDVDGTPKVVVMSDETLNVLTSTIALLVAGSSKCASRQMTRAFCDEHAKNLRGKIAKAKQSDQSFIHYLQVKAVH